LLWTEPSQRDIARENRKLTADAAAVVVAGVEEYEEEGEEDGEDDGGGSDGGADGSEAIAACGTVDGARSRRLSLSRGISLFLASSALHPTSGPLTPPLHRSESLSRAIIFSRSPPKATPPSHPRARASVFGWRFARAMRKAAAAHRARIFAAPTGRHARANGGGGRKRRSLGRMCCTENGGRVAVAGVAYVYARWRSWGRNVGRVGGLQSGYSVPRVNARTTRTPISVDTHARGIRTSVVFHFSY